MNKCPKCQEDIQENAKKCKHCGSDLRNWFARHKILTVVLALIIIVVAASASSGGESGGEDNSKKSFEITKENCDLIKTEMTGEEVKSIMGDPTSTSETEIAGVGSAVFWQYQKGLSLQACSVTLTNGKVTTKSWTDL